MRLMYNISKRKFGEEDIEIGTGHVFQDRSTEPLHKISLTKKMGTIHSAIVNKTLNEVPNDINTLYFSGFYTDGDGGEGYYFKQKNKIPQNLGIILNSNTASYRRQNTISELYVSWFGAVGDGKANDLEPFLAALKLGGTIVLQPKTYLLQGDKELEIIVSNNINIVGNNATIILQALNASNLLNFKFNEASYFILSNANIESIGLNKAFTFTNANIARYINTSHFVTYKPASSAVSYNNFLYTRKEQILAGNIKLAKNPTSKVNPTLGSHPVRRDFIDKVVAPQGSYLTKDANQTITAMKNYHKPIKVAEPTKDSHALTNTALNNKVSASIADLIKLIPSYKAPAAVPLYYLQFKASEANTPAKLWPDYKWEKVIFDDTIPLALRGFGSRLVDGKNVDFTANRNGKGIERQGVGNIETQTHNSLRSPLHNAFATGKVTVGETEYTFPKLELGSPAIVPELVKPTEETPATGYIFSSEGAVSSSSIIAATDTTDYIYMPSKMDVVLWKRVLE